MCEVTLMLCLPELSFLFLVQNPRSHVRDEVKINNKPPLSIAIAGPDQIITLLSDSISLAGIASNDPDEKISDRIAIGWLWNPAKGGTGPASSYRILQADFIVWNDVPAFYLIQLR